MNTKLLFLVACFLIFATCVSKKAEEYFVKDGTAAFFDQNQQPFYHGVASGDPLSDRVIIWTRVTPLEAKSVSVKWAVSKNANMEQVVQTGDLKTGPSKNYTVKVDVTGLSANTTYYYQFEALGKKSLIGKTKTIAVDDEDQIKLAIVSCSNYEAGYYNAFARIAEKEDLDAVVHLGDYIYEYQPGGYGDESLDRKHLPAKEITILSDYRTRYAQYRLDKDFQKAHQMHPFIVIWDDHEVANDAYKEGAENHQPDKEGNFQTRKEAAKQAYFEWLPVRDNPTKDIYRTIRFGNLADLIMLDERLAGRTYPMDSIGQAEFKEAARSMLGKEQLTWFKNELKTSDAIWKVIGNQVIFSILDLSATGYKNPVNLDAWDGYPYERQQISRFLKNNQIENVIITTGDTHASWAFEVPVDVASYQSNAKENTVAIEFGTTSITSANFDEEYPVEEVKKLEGGLLNSGKNPHLKYVNLRDHGYMVLTLNKKEAIAEWFFVDKINAPSKNERIGKKLIVKSGETALAEGIAN